ncbi:flagellar assembly protein FliH [Anaerobacillus sp. CMMVII]|uniref:flagellar assembly protein FliH n=1 Tax=Anaerobacillus sp. CMMVII TaxID=2755588 RepID=UPI0021B7AB88|nr:flagellar assembly protein FliH [Anaerobacillus sp. CMMVII]MCT8139821.1 flagellar assembly protein FliH [Anaerobacillus sp. CMMVII]
MSKIIKSSLANNPDSEKRTIGLRSLTKFVNSTQMKNDSKENSSEINSKLVDEVLQKAMEEAESIRNEAKYEYEHFQERMNHEIQLNQQKAEDLYKHSEETGYNQGFQQGLQEGQRQYETFIQEAREIINASKEDYFQKLEDAEQVIVELAVKVSEKVIANSLKQEPSIWLPIVKAVIDEVREQEQVKIYVHPKWYEFTLAHKEELRLLLPNCENLYIYPDIHLDENGCQIETPYGKIDASVNSQLAEIKRALEEKLKELSGNEGC